MHVHTIFVAAASALVISSAAPAQYATIVDLGPMDNEYQLARAMSEGGQVVGFDGLPCGPPMQAFLWSEAGGYVALGALPGHSVSGATCINGRGVAAGWSAELGCGGTAVVWSGRTVNAIMLPGEYSFAYVAGINDRHDLLINAWFNPNATSVALLWRNGSIVDLGSLGGDSTSARAISNQGLIVGRSHVAANQFVAFRWCDGVMTALPSNGENECGAYACNDAGLIAGFCGPDAVVWHDGGIEVLERPYFVSWAEAYGMNEAGHVVGTAGYQYAMLWKHGEAIRLIDLLPPTSGWSKLIEAWDINDHGQIVGNGYHDGEYSAFLITLPAPCPADLSDDYAVNVADLLMLLAAWGPCPAAAECPADLDGDDAVGAADLTMLLLAWGDCG